MTIQVRASSEVTAKVNTPEPAPIIIPDQNIYGRSTCSYQDIIDSKYDQEVHYTGPRYTPFDFASAIAITDNLLREKGVKVINTAYALVEGDNTCYAAWQVDHQEYNTSQEYTPIIHLKNSYNGKHALTIVLGSYTFCCFNGLLTGEYKIRLKHTGMIEGSYSEQLAQHLLLLPEAIRADNQRYERFKGLSPSPDMVNNLMIQTVRDNIIPAGALKRVIKYWDKPEFEEFEANGDSMYRLLQSYTSVMRPPYGKRAQVGQASITNAQKRLPKLVKLLDKTADKIQEIEDLLSEVDREETVVNEEEYSILGPVITD